MRSLHLLVAVVAVTSVRSVPVEEASLDKRLVGGVAGGLLGGGGKGGLLGGDLVGGLVGGKGGLLGGDLVGGLVGGKDGLLGGDLVGGVVKSVSGVVGDVLDTAVGVTGGVVDTVKGLLDGLTNGLAGAKTKDDVIAQFEKLPLDQLCPACRRIENEDHRTECRKYCQAKGFKVVPRALGGY